MEQLENIMLQPEIKHSVNWDEYDEKMNYEFDRECEDGDDW